MENTENIQQESIRREGNRHESAKHEGAKQPYERPTLKEWGTVADLTNSGGGGPSGDPLGGSVGC